MTATTVNLSRSALRGMEWVAYPALAGLAFCLLALGVVTWLPALAAAAHALHLWRTDHEHRPFLTTLRSFPGYWRRLWRHGLASTAVAVVAAANIVFLASQPHAWAFALLAAQVGIVAALVVYHFALAAVAALRPDGDWRGRALVLAFGSPVRGAAILAAALLTPVITLPLSIGPLLFGPMVPLLVALELARR